MTFSKIDIKNWDRREYFDHYLENVPCSYSMTVKLDITRIRANKIKLYPKMLHSLSTIINRHKEFRMAFNASGQLGIFEKMNPCYTIFHKDNETFSNLWTSYSENYYDFLSAYEKDISEFENIKGFFPKQNMPENCFTISMVPWTTFESFNLNLPKGEKYLLPIFTIGKYYKENEKYFLPIAIQVHHAVCDGFHTCRFINELQELINE